LGRIEKIQKEGSNLHFDLRSSLTDRLKVDQSLAHNGVCLTVVRIEGDIYTVTAVDETLKRTNLGLWKVGERVNLELAMSPTSLLDGHIVQGHVDTTARCVARDALNGSWYFTFAFDTPPQYPLVDKGSVAVNGVSLTVVEPVDTTFSVAIIPYTFEHTTFGNLEVGDCVNIEFDIIGKYIAKYTAPYLKNRS
jgi:riboflavin synthase